MIQVLVKTLQKSFLMHIFYYWKLSIDIYIVEAILAAPGWSKNKIEESPVAGPLVPLER